MLPDCGEGESDGSLWIGAWCVKQTAPVFHCSSRAGKIVVFNPENCLTSIGIGDPPFFSGRLIRVRPRAVFPFLHEIAETVPGKFSVGYGAAEGDLPVRNTDDFPVSMPGTICNINLLSYLKRVRSKRNDSVVLSGHSLLL
jgi:hypothetical protein